MSDKLIFILPVITVLLFVINIFYNGNNVQSCVLFVLTLLPLMDLKVTLEAQGGFKTFDGICFYSFVFLIKDFTTINLTKKNNFYLFMFAVLAIVLVLGGLTSEFPDKTYLNLIKLLPIFIFARFLLTECYIDRSFFYRAINALKISYITALVFLLIQAIVGLKFTFYPGLSINTVDPVFHVVRYPGVFFDSQAHGQYLAMGSFLFLFNEHQASRNKMIINYVIFALSLLAIVAAGSRAAFGGFGIGLIVVIFLAGRQYLLYGGIFVVIAGLFYLFVMPHAGMFDRTKNLTDDYLFRQGIWNEAFAISEKHPYIGIGSGNYQSYVMRHNQDQYLEFEDGKLVYFDQPENGYLKIIVELGYIGFGVFALFMLIPIIKGLVYRLKGVFDYRVVFLVASLLSWLVAFNTVYSIYDYRILIMVTCMVVLITCYPNYEETEIYELAEE